MGYYFPLNSLKLSIVMSLCIFSLMIMHGNSVEFEVGGPKGWIVPPRNDSQVFNEWAQKNRFKINDTLKFKYAKDSVLLVTEEEYKKCETSKPIFFSNNGNTSFLLDRPGLFYFISGVTGHCQHGQKLIVKVLDIAPAAAATPPSHVPSENDTASSNIDENINKKKNGSTKTMMSSTSCVFLSLVLVFGVFFV